MCPLQPYFLNLVGTCTATGCDRSLACQFLTQCMNTDLSRLFLHTLTPQGATRPASQRPQPRTLQTVANIAPTMTLIRGRMSGIVEHGGQRLNDEQRLAVAAVLGGAAAGSPFVLFGPPGTGKTVTLVECVLQARDVHISCASNRQGLLT